VVASDDRTTNGRQSRRTIAFVLIGTGAASLVGTVIFGVVGAAQHTSIQNGGFATSSAIASADSLGVAANVGFGVTLVAGLLFEAIGVPLLVANLGSDANVQARSDGIVLRW
jgi:hypothetical protein